MNRNEGDPVSLGTKTTPLKAIFIKLVAEFTYPYRCNYSSLSSPWVTIS